MCGIAGQISLEGYPIGDLGPHLELMSKLISHRGPDGSGLWKDMTESVGFAHRRLAIIDLEDPPDNPCWE